MVQLRGEVAPHVPRRNVDNGVGTNRLRSARFTQVVFHPASLAAVTVSALQAAVHPSRSICTSRHDASHPVPSTAPEFTCLSAECAGFSRDQCAPLAHPGNRNIWYILPQQLSSCPTQRLNPRHHLAACHHPSSSSPASRPSKPNSKQWCQPLVPAAPSILATLSARAVAHLEQVHLEVA